jgi:hypothetical protein
MKTTKVKSSADIPQNYTGIVVFPGGIKQWRLDGLVHREDGPAMVWPNRKKQWYLNGELHREEGPAVVCPNGEKHWLLNGKYHREEGPAIVWAIGTKEWWLNGKQVDKKTVELYYMLKYKKLIKL